VDATNSVHSGEGPVVVAIPVHNEAAHIEHCLLALARQTCARPFETVALLNNCTDETARIVRRVAPAMPYKLHVRECWIDPSMINAGVARRLATQHAASIAKRDGIILTTDADSRVASNWIAANIAEIDAGSDAVAGMAQLDDQDAASLPGHLLIDEEKSEAFGTLLDEIDWLLDPDAADPWPRHTQHSGASIAVRAGWLARAGGIPAVPLGEDRQLFAQLRRVDARIRHSRNVVVTVSGRIVGRAKGGMADTIARRMREGDKWLDDCLEPAADRVRRATLRAFMRRAWPRNPHGDSAAALAKALRLPPAIVSRAFEAATFGRAWGDLERASLVLRRRTVLAKDLERETIAARAIVDDLQAARDRLKLTSTSKT
jgi:hypothetical protein